MMRAIFLLLCAAMFSQAEQSPLLVWVAAQPGEAPRIAGWETVAVKATPDDAGVKTIEAAVEQARRERKTDPLRTYIAGRGVDVSTVFYAVSRAPDLWAAALAVGGSPKPAIDSGRLFGANTQLVPVLWLVAPADRDALDPLFAKLAAAEFNLAPVPTGLSGEKAVEWLAGQKRDQYPEKVDCETGSPLFARCYWAEITRFEPSQRNDVLASTRVRPGSGASLDLGSFGFKLDAPGPGVAVEWLPDNYKGPLKLGDRIVSIGGKEVADAHAYTEMMDRTAEEKRVGLMIQRGKERVRLESRIVMPKRGLESPTARIQAQHLPDTKELLVITRGVGQVRVTLPDYWTPCALNWNGNEMGKADSSGCWMLTWGGTAARCATETRAGTAP